ncbi:MAG TPA: AAA family ATPase, partial [Blastocatellia bacterium]
MYIDRIKLDSFRTFRKAEIVFNHPDVDFAAVGRPRPKIPNVNLLLGDNGYGKSAMLKAVALTCLGPAVRSAGIYPYSLVRREPAHQKAGNGSKVLQPTRATLEATFTPHEQDRAGEHGRILSKVEVVKKEDLEQLEWANSGEDGWRSIYSSRSDAFFFVGYGATRRVERQERVDLGSRHTSTFLRAQRVQSLFEDFYSLIPLNSWLPQFKTENPRRHEEAINLINSAMGRGHYSFAGEVEDREYLFERGRLKIPFPALSDGYRAFLGWIGDLLYHMSVTSPRDAELVGNKGIVLVDEIDLHLHPQWQMGVLPVLARTLPNLQFIVTSHSPLVVGSLEWMNIILMSPGPRQSSRPKQLEWPIHGLDADQ